MPDQLSKAQLIRNDIERKRPDIKRQVSGWQALLIDNLNYLYKILDWIYDYLINTSEPDIRNLNSIKANIIYVNTVVKEDVFALERHLKDKANPMNVNPDQWGIFINKSKTLFRDQFLDAIEELNIYADLLQAKQQQERHDENNKKGRWSLFSKQKDIKTIHKQWRAFIDKYVVFADRFGSIVKPLKK